MATFKELRELGHTRIRRRLWNETAYLEVEGLWVTLHDPAGYAAIGVTTPYRWTTLTLPWDEDNEFEVYTGDDDVFVPGGE